MAWLDAGRARWMRIARASAIGLVAGVSFAGLAASGWLERVELMTFDLRTEWTAAPWASTDRIAIVLIDEPSLAVVEENYQASWPWRRDFYKYVVRYAAESGARALVVDALFPDGRAGDEGLAATLREIDMPVVLAGASVEQGIDLDPSIRETLRRFAWSDFGAAEGVPTARSFVPPVGVLLDAASAVGNASVRLDVDETSRRVAFLTKTRNGVVPTLALATFALAEPATVFEWTAGTLRVGPGRLPLDANGFAVLRFPDPTRLYPTYSFAALLDSYVLARRGESPTIPPEALRDRVVFLGASALGLKDVQRFPYAGRGETLPGVLLHAIAYDNLLHGSGMRPPSLAETLTLTLALGTATPLLLMLLPIPWGLPAALGLLGAASLASIQLFDAGVWIGSVAPLGAGSLGFALAAAVQYVTEGRARMAVRRAFSHYLPEPVLERVLADPERFLTRWGVRKPMTVLFLDFENFTGLAERMGAHELVEALNRYLGAATDVVFRHEGILDKYVGDSLIAFWGDPIDQPDQARRACLAGLEIQREIERLAVEDLRDGKARLKARIGINSGDMVVGNMGSGRLFDYTVIGDNVNLGARLEEANKLFGTGIVVSEATRLEAGEDLFFRALGRIRVKGRVTPVRLYELRASLVASTAAERARVQRFTEGVAAYERGDWDDAERIFEDLALEDPADLACVVYRLEVERIREAARTGAPTETVFGLE